jgi:hypothetical protein
MSHSTDPPMGSRRRTATGPGLRDLLRSPSGLGGRPGGGHGITRPGSAATLVGSWGRDACSGNRRRELLGTGWRNPVPSRGGR